MKKLNKVASAVAKRPLTNRFNALPGSEKSIVRKHLGITGISGGAGLFALFFIADPTIFGFIALLTIAAGFNALGGVAGNEIRSNIVAKLLVAGSDFKKSQNNKK